MKLKDLTGEKFGNLVVVRQDAPYVAPSGQKSIMWICQCDCGNTRSFRSYDLRHGKVLHCGCRKWSHKFNDTREEGQNLYIKVGDKEVIIDKEDLEKIYPARVVIGNNGYAYSNHKLVHRTVTGCKKGFEVDHINHNTLDNRKSNLRIVTRSINNVNKKAVSNTGTIGITRRKDGYYQVTVDNTYCGIRKTFEDALSLRNESLKGTRQEKYNYFLQEGSAT